MKKCFAIILSIIMLFTGLSPVFGAQTDGAGQSDHYVLKDGINTYTGVTFWLDANGEYYVSTATSYENRKTDAVFSSSGKAAPGIKWDSGKWILTNISITRDDIFPLHVYSSNVTTVIEYDGSVELSSASSGAMRLYAAGDPMGSFEFKGRSLYSEFKAAYGSFYGIDSNYPGDISNPSSGVKVYYNGGNFSIKPLQNGTTKNSFVCGVMNFIVKDGVRNVSMKLDGAVSSKNSYVNDWVGNGYTDSNLWPKSVECSGGDSTEKDTPRYYQLHIKYMCDELEDITVTGFEYGDYVDLTPYVPARTDGYEFDYWIDTSKVFNNKIDTNACNIYLDKTIEAHYKESENTQDDVQCSLSPAFLSLKTGETGTLSATVTPSGTPIVWGQVSTGSDSPIEISSSGTSAQIKAVKAGTVTVYPYPASYSGSSTDFCRNGNMCIITVTQTGSNGDDPPADDDPTDEDKVFKLGRDNNSYIHYNGKGGGFEERSDYTFRDVKYYDALVDGQNSGVISGIKDFLPSEWGGSCYGVSATMARVYDGLDKPSDYVSGVKDYYSLPKPNADKKYDDIVNYYMLSQFCNWGTISEHMVSKREGTAALEAFLRDLVDATAGNKVKMFCYAHYTGGHAILAVNSFKNTSGNYELELYDLNSFTGKDTGFKRSMIIAPDFSDFSYALVGSNTEKLEDGWSWLCYYDTENMQSLSRIISASGTRIQAAKGDAFKVTNENGGTLVFDGKEIVESETTMNIYSLHGLTMDNALDSKNVFDIDQSVKFTVEPYNNDTSVDIAITTYDDYASVQAEGYEKAYIDLYEKTEIEGSKYSFRVSQQSDNVIQGYEKGLSTISGKATANTVFEETEKGIKATSANKLTDVQTSSHIGNTYYTRKESDSTTIEVSSEDTKGEKEGSDENLSDTGSDNDNTTGRPKDTYYVGEKTDAHARYFKSVDKLGVKVKYKIADSDKKLASINGKGIFKGKNPGKVTIEVYIKEHGKYVLWDHVKVTVIPKPLIKFTDKFTTLSSEIDVWKYVTPDGAKVYPPDKWESSNESVAVIDKTGKIKVKGPGSTKITGYFGDLKVKATLKIKPFKRKKDNC